MDGARDIQTLIDCSCEIASTLPVELHLMQVSRNPVYGFSEPKG
jgi:hypothetical protein